MIETIHNNQSKFLPSIKKFLMIVSDTKAELWDTPDELIRDVSKNVKIPQWRIGW